MESDLIFGVIIFGFPVGATIWGYFHLRRPENRAAYDRRNAGRDSFGSDAWGSF
jgi:hypothetical protein